MHPSARQNCQHFFDTYRNAFSAGSKIVEIGSQDVNGGLRDIFPNDFNYVGVDFVAGKGVDVVLDDPYQLPFATESLDIVISSSCFEHSEMFWLTFLEILRVLKPGVLAPVEY
jgi:SAM-dependent methyltransferase